MGKQIAFLRAINVGGHQVAMARLKELFEEVGLNGVSTFINSGNVIFETDNRPAAALEEVIEGRLHEALGYEVATFIRSDAEVATLANSDPFAGRAGTVHVVFLKQPPPTPARGAVLALAGERDELVLEGREVVWWTEGKLMGSGLKPDAIGKALGGMPNTARNRNTVQKLAAKYPPD